MLRKSFLGIIFSAILLLIIWYLTKFYSPFLSLPFWVILILNNYNNSYKLVSILIVSEFFIGIDTLTFGPISIIQIIGLMVLLSNMVKLKENPTKSFLFGVLFLTFLYFTTSYYQYYGSITLAPLNWIFILFITVISFRGEEAEIYFISWLTVISISIITFINFIIQAIYGVQIVKSISFGNPNQIGFYSLFCLIYLVYLYSFYEGKSKGTLIKALFYFNTFYVLFTTSRLNTAILILFFISLFIFPIKSFWINRKKLIFIVFLSTVALLASGAVGSFIFRNNENEALKNIKFSSIEDLNDSDLGSFTSARSVIYYDAYTLISDKPFFGNGFLSWNDANNNYNSLVTSADGGRISMHSTILQYWAETGLIGLVLYLMYLTGIIRNGRKLIKNTNNRKYYYIGKLVVYIGTFMLLGSLLDNHSLSYAQIHFVAALSIIFIKMKKNEKKNSILY